MMGRIYPILGLGSFVYSVIHWPLLILMMVHMWSLSPHVIGLVIVLYFLRRRTTPWVPLTDFVWRYISEQHRIHYMGDDVPVIHDKPTIHLLFPHGMVCVEQMALLVDLMKRQRAAGIDTGRNVLMVDKVLYAIQPIAVVILQLGMGLSILPLKHVLIQRHLRSRVGDVFVMPGGFAETVGYTDAVQTIFTGTVGYWTRQCKEHGYNLRISHMYNGSSMIAQSGYGMSFRMWLANTYKIAIVLPTGIRDVEKLVVRTWEYEPEDIPENIAGAIQHFITVDRNSPDFPVPSKEYVILDQKLKPIVDDGQLVIQKPNGQLMTDS